jgi:hypothetical protein
MISLTALRQIFVFSLNFDKPIDKKLLLTVKMEMEHAEENPPKIEWEDTSIYGYLKDGILTLHKEDKDFSWIISDGDINGKDFIILDLI